MKRLAVVSALVVAVGLVGQPAQAAVGSSSWITIPSTTFYEGCIEVPYSLAGLNAWASQQAKAWGNINGYYNYDVDIDVTGPDGTSAGTAYAIRSADDYTVTGSDPGEFATCADPGRYLVRVHGHWCPIDEDPQANPADCQTVDFTAATIINPTATKLSPLKPTKKRVKVKVKRALKIKTAMSIQRATGFYAFDGSYDAALQRKKGKRWKTITKTSSTNGATVHFSAKFKKPGKYAVRAVVLNRGTYYASSATKTLHVRVTR